MEYTLEIDGTPATIPGGTGVLLLHPSTGETDRIDTDFFKTDTDNFLVVSTRTTAREVRQKLEYYDVDEERAEILDTLSIERGYSRRSSDTVHYVAAPDDVDGIVDHIDGFLDEHDGKRRISIDSVTELAYYAGDERALEAVDRVLELLAEYDAVGLFHLAKDPHDEELVERFRNRFDGVIDLDEDGSIEAEF
ncbi:ATPase involved in flagella biogenesis [Natrinema saccharevitans]|uniref:ATPase involved in flagella biogenesis n=1 Tax=Natrinema saccharevitans TaxID=301967 RepID=A0A1S8B002_9EURY|nr:ATPase domain-containing protein [Natrinema saccharevitans]OLZ42383.1 ATPase involved in flagella biogenesis [Natrinema saccharevitans]